MDEKPKQPIYMIVGVPGSGKTWTTNQIKNKFHFIHHDLFIGQAGDAYVRTILKEAPDATKPILIEAPFSISTIKDPIEKAGYRITPVFIIEDEPILMARYLSREKKPIPPGHLTRQKTYKKRAMDGKHFYGTSQQVMEHLKSI